MEVLVFVLSAAILAIQLFAWRWANRLAGNLEGQTGAELSAVLSWVIGGITVVRVIGMIGSVALGYTHITLDNALLLSTVTQGVTAIVLLIAVWRVRELSREAPVDGSGEAMIQSDAQPAGQVPPSS